MGKAAGWPGYMPPVTISTPTYSLQLPVCRNINDKQTENDWLCRQAFFTHMYLFVVLYPLSVSKTSMIKILKLIGYVNVILTKCR